MFQYASAIDIRRFVKPWYVWRPWQLARRARTAWRPPRHGYHPLPVAWGVSLLADPRTSFGWSIDTTGIHDLAVAEVLARLIRPGDTVVDAGAHVGYMTVLAALAAGPQGHVIAWEPHPELFRLLERNVANAAARHRLGRITLKNAALATTAGRAELAVPDEDARNDATSRLVSEASPSVPSIEVTVETLDEALDGTPVDLMKLDVEGSEHRVLGGASRALRAGRLRHVVFEDHQGPASDVIRLLESLGYEIFAIGWSVRRLKLGPPDVTLAADYEAPSYLATLAAGEVRNRCAKAGWVTLNARFANGRSR